MTHVIRFLSFAFRYVLGLALVLLLLLAAVVGLLGFTPFGASIVARQVAGLASMPGRIVHVSTPTGLLSGHLRIPEVTLADSQGVYARLRNISVDWTPSALLSHAFKAETISAEKVEVYRPALDEAPAPDPNAPPFKLPVSVDVKHIQLPDVEIGKAAAGRDFRLAASGSGHADNDTIAVNLLANRRDLPDAKAAAELSFIPGENRLTLKASLDEPRDGLIAGMLNLPGRPALHMTVDGQGPLSDWSGKLTAALDGGREFTAVAHHQAVADNGHRLVLQGEGPTEALMPPTVRDLFAGNTAFAFDAILGAAGRLQVTSGSLTTDAVTLSVAGTYDPNGSNDLTAHAFGTRGPVAFQVPAGTDTARLLVETLDLSLKGQAEKAMLDVRGKIATAEFPGYRLDHVDFAASSDSLDLKTRSGTGDLSLSFETGTFADANLQRLLPGPFSLKAPLTVSREQLAFHEATIESARLGGTFSGQFDIASRLLKTDLKIFALPGVLPDQLASRFTGKLTLAGMLAYAPGGAVTLSNAAFDSNLLTARGDVGLDKGQVRAALQGTLPRLEALLADAKGSAAYTLDASGPLSAPDFKATMKAGQAVLAGRKLETLSLEASGKADPKAPSARVSASGALGGQVITAEADLKSEDGVTSLPVLKVDIGPNHLEGQLRFSREFLPDGTVTFNLPDIGLVAALAGEKATGDLKGKAEFSNAGGVAAAKINASGKGIQRDGLSVRDPRIALDIADLKTLAASGKVEAGELASGANRLAGLALSFDRKGPETQFDLKAAYDGKPVLASGGVTVAAGRTTVAIASASAAPKGIALKLAKPSTVVIENGTAKLSATTLQAGKGTVTVSGSAGASLDLTADIESLPLGLANTVVPSLAAEGSVSGKVDVSGKAANPAVTYRLAFDRATLAQVKAAGLSPLTIKADGRFENNQLKLNSTASNGDGLSVKGGGTASLAGKQSLNLAFDGSIPFKALSGVLAAQGLEISGKAAFDVKIGGTVQAPAITGRLTSSDAQLVDVRHNIALRGMALAIDIDRNRATVSKLTGTLSTGGTVSVSGSVGTAPGTSFPADLKITLNKAAYVDGKLVSTVVDGTMTLTGPLLANPTLAGKLALGRSAITIPQKLPASLAKINVKHRNESRAVAQQRVDVMSRSGGGKGGNSSSSIGLDLTISAPRIFVQGRGIDAELGGDVTLQGTVANPLVSGGFKMKRGRMTILNRRLDFTSGTITFGGDLTPTLAMAAEADSGSTTITVGIDGPANDPQISFSSSPSLPQDEVLAQLIFQQSLSRLSVLQIAQLADAAAQLAGGRSTSLLQGLRSNLGIDDLDITSDENGNAQVKAGKYLNDRTYIQIEQGGSSGGKASINLDVGRGLKLKGEAGTDGGGAAGIFYEKEY